MLRAIYRPDFAPNWMMCDELGRVRIIVGKDFDPGIVSSRARGPEYMPSILTIWS